MDNLTPRFNNLKRLSSGCLGLLLLVVASCFPARAQDDFSVTGGNNIDYFIDGQNDPSLELQRGVTYIFLLSNVAIHPFWIKSFLDFGSSGAYNDGVVNNGATSGSVSFTVPQSAPDTLYYQCGAHPSMNGVLNIVTPATPPEVTIVYIGIGDFVTLKSTGTNGWSPVPEFVCSLLDTNWTQVPSFTNSYSAGTNTTTFDRLDPICGSPSVLLRIRNQQD